MTAALRYARAGLPVLPLHAPGSAGRCSCRRPGCPRPGKHPRVPHGLTEASTDPARILAWWRRWPAANVGVRTGGVADVCDIDSDAGWAGLVAVLGGPPPEAPLARTGSGWHLYLAATGHGNRVRVVPGVDWRGAGGYVVAPPSRHANGRWYEWIRPFSSDLPECPAPLLRLLAPAEPRAPVAIAELRRPDRYARVALDREAARVAGAAVGERNQTLYRAARALARLAEAGLLDRREVTAVLSDAAAAAGLGRVESGRTIRSGLTGPR